MLKGLTELRFYIDEGVPMVYIKYFDKNMAEKTLRIKQKHIDSEVGRDVTELAKRIISKHNEAEGIQ